MQPPLSQKVLLPQLLDQEICVEFVATEEERRILCQRFDWESCPQFQGRARLHKAKENHYKIDIFILAKVEQLCIQTLQPLLFSIEENLTKILSDKDELDQTLEVIKNNTLDLAELMSVELFFLVPQYPRQDLMKDSSVCL